MNSPCVSTFYFSTKEPPSVTQYPPLFQGVTLSTATSHVDIQTASELKEALSKELGVQTSLEHHEILGPAAELSDIVSWISVVADVLDVVDAAKFLAGVFSGPLFSRIRALIQKSSPKKEGSAPAVPVAITFSSVNNFKSVRFYFHRVETESDLKRAINEIPQMLETLPKGAFEEVGGPPMFGYFYDFSEGQWRGTNYFDSVTNGEVSYSGTWFPPEGLFQKEQSKPVNATRVSPEILEYSQETAFRDDLSDRVAVFIPRSTGEGTVEELIDFVEMYKRVGSPNFPTGTLVHPYEIPPAAGTWEYFALLPIEGVRQLLTDIVLIWEASKLVRISINWLEERASGSPRDQRLFLSQGSVLSLVIAHQVETYGFQSDLSVSVEPRGRFQGYNHPDHPNDTIYYLIKCETSARNESYLVDSTAKVKRYLVRTEDQVMDIPPPDLLELRQLASEDASTKAELEVTLMEPLETSRPHTLSEN